MFKKNIIKRFKTKSGMTWVILLMLMFVVGSSYALFVFTSTPYRAGEMLIGKYLYGLNITTTGGSETINGKVVTLSAPGTSTINVKITSLNNARSKYELDYKINNGSGNIYYSSSTGWLPTGEINKSGEGIYEKTIKVVVNTNTTITVEFDVSGGYTFNSINTIENYNKVENEYQGIISYSGEKLNAIIQNEADNNIYGGEAKNNYFSYDEEKTKMYRIMGLYNLGSTTGIKVVSNSVVGQSGASSIVTSLNNYYNTLEDADNFVVNTNYFTCNNLTCSANNKYNKIGLLSTNEYIYFEKSKSYLNINNASYFTENGSALDKVTGDTIENNNTSTSGVRPAMYMNNDICVTGEGTLNNPYILMKNAGDLILKATYYGSSTFPGHEENNNTQSQTSSNGECRTTTNFGYFPKYNDPYLPTGNVTCENGSAGYYDIAKDEFKLTTINLPDTCSVDFKEGHSLVIYATGVGVSQSNLSVGRTGSANVSLIPESGKTNLETLSCDNGANVVKNDNTLSITNVTTNTTCTIEMSEPITLLTQVLADNPTRSTRSSFSSVYTTQNTGTIYETNLTDDDSTVYYFAGNALNNWVVFGSEGSSDICWRVIRSNTASEGSGVRLLYSGKWDGSTCGNTTSAYVGSSTTYTVSGKEDPSYIGYMYTNGNNLEEDRANGTSSKAKQVVDNWFSSTSNLNQTEQLSKINTKAIYCSDRSLGPSDTYSNSDEFDFAAAWRLESNNSPSLKCTVKADKFTVDSSTGNGQLTYPAALITADEIEFAGASASGSTNSQAWYYYNNSTGSITGSNHWWTMTPESFYLLEGWISSYDTMRDCVFLVGGSESDDYIGPGRIVGHEDNISGVIRPVISLINDVIYSSGNGSPANPYRIVE